MQEWRSSSTRCREERRKEPSRPIHLRWGVWPGSALDSTLRTASERGECFTSYLFVIRAAADPLSSRQPLPPGEPKSRRRPELLPQNIDNLPSADSNAV